MCHRSTDYHRFKASKTNQLIKLSSQGVPSAAQGDGEEGGGGGYSTHTRTTLRVHCYGLCVLLVVVFTPLDTQ